MFIISIISWLVFGFLVGLIARMIYPGRQSMGLLQTSFLGIVGSVLGGLLGNLLFGVPMLAVHGAGFVGSILGALLVLAMLHFASDRSVPT